MPLPSLALRTPGVLRLGLLSLGMLVLASTVPAQAPTPKPSAVYLKDGDPVVVQMTGVPSALTIATYVRRGGSIDVAPAGTVQVDGLSASDAAQQVQSVLEGHFPRPHVTLTPIQLGSSMFFITGDVRKPAAYAVTQGLTVRQAVTEVAGNVTLWCPHPWYLRLLESCSAKVSIVRPDAQGNLELLSTEFGDWFLSGTQAVRAGDLLSVRVFLDHPPAD